MEFFLVSTGVAAFAEIGDKMQPLAFILAGFLGAWITAIVSPEILRWILGFFLIHRHGASFTFYAGAVFSGFAYSKDFDQNNLLIPQTSS